MSDLPHLDHIRYPELELDLFSGGYNDRCKSFERTTTSVNLLEVYSQWRETIWRKSLSHDQLMGHLTTNSKGSEPKSRPILRIIVVNTDDTKPGTPYRSKVNIATLEGLRDHLGLSEIYIGMLTNPSRWFSQGNFHEVIRGSSGSAKQYDSIYRLGFVAKGCHVWRSYNTNSKETNYVISNCPREAGRAIVECATSPLRYELLRAFVVESFLVNQYFALNEKKITSRREQLVRYERERLQRFGEDDFEELHSIMKQFQIIHQDLNDLEGSLDYLLEIHQQSPAAEPLDFRGSSDSSIRLLRSRIRIMKSWAESYQSRTQVQIGLVFHLSQQKDSRTNLQVAETSKDIAEATRKDSSSMITLAVLTMIFLPGSFTSAFLSMPFFETQTGPDGNPSFVVDGHWWIFFAISLPLTAIAIISWLVWHRHRQTRSTTISFTGGQANPKHVSRGFDPSKLEG